MIKSICITTNKPCEISFEPNKKQFTPFFCNDCKVNTEMKKEMLYQIIDTIRNTIIYEAGRKKIVRRYKELGGNKAAYKIRIVK